MKLSILLSGLICIWSTSVFANDALITKAQQSYEQRGFDAAGITQVEQSADFYSQALAAAQNTVQKVIALNGLAQTKYFLGTAYSDEKQKIDIFAQGMGSADAVAAEFGIDNAHKMSESQIQKTLSEKSDDEVKSLAVSMYLKGISLAQWGKLKGISTSIGRIGEVMGNMEMIKALGHESIFQYGPDRTIGRVKFTLPKIFGGDLKLSEKLLKNAYKNTLATSANGEPLKYSMNGYNTIYLSETMYKRKKEAAAIKILELFVAADPATLAQDIMPENEQALAKAQELMVVWQ